MIKYIITVLSVILSFTTEVLGQPFVPRTFGQNNRCSTNLNSVYSNMKSGIDGDVAVAGTTNNPEIWGENSKNDCSDVPVCFIGFFNVTDST